MVRTIVQVIQVRMSDVMSGDIINKNADDPRGWFMVKDIQPLPNGDIAVLAETDRNSINGGPYDMVGVQVTKRVEIPDAAKQAA